MINSSKIRLVEVGPRDGLQNESTLVPLEEKVQLIRSLLNCGIPLIEASSFVRADRIPQMKDSDELMSELKQVLLTSEWNRLCVLVPNMHGLEKALKAGVKEVAVFTACSETFNQTNIQTSIQGARERLQPVLELCQQESTRVRGYVSTVFGCPYEGAVNKIHEKNLLQETQWLLDNGAYEVSLGDTIGLATPKLVAKVMAPLIQQFGTTSLALHFHDTRGMALINILEGLKMGIRSFDSSIGGLGGCPYAKGASGNVATEELVYMLKNLSPTDLFDPQTLDFDEKILFAITKRLFEQGLKRSVETSHSKFVRSFYASSSCQ